MKKLNITEKQQRLFYTILFWYIIGTSLFTSIGSILQLSWMQTFREIDMNIKLYAVFPLIIVFVLLRWFGIIPKVTPNIGILGPNAGLTPRQRYFKIALASLLLVLVIYLLITKF